MIDKIIGIYGNHRITKCMIETITYIAQLVPSFERASAAMKKLCKVDVSAKQIQIVSEEVGKEAYKKERNKRTVPLFHPCSKEINIIDILLHYHRNKPAGIWFRRTYYSIRAASLIRYQLVYTLSYYF